MRTAMDFRFLKTGDIVVGCCDARRKDANSLRVLKSMSSGLEDYDYCDVLVEWQRGLFSLILEF